MMTRVLIALLLLVLSTVRAYADITMAWAGQSLCSEMFTVTGGGASPLYGTYVYDWANNAWVAPSGDGAIEYANAMKLWTGQNVYMYNGCIGGSALLQADVDPANPTNYWLDPGMNNPRQWLVNQISWAQRPIQYIEWDQGQADYISTSPNIYGEYYSGLISLYSGLLGALGRTSSDLPILVWSSGNYNNGTSMHVNSAQALFVANMPGAYQAPGYYDLPTRDGTHLLNGTQYRVKADRGASNALRFWGLTWGGPGPSVSGATRVTDTVTVDIHVTPGTHLKANAAVSGFRIWDSSWTEMTPVSVAVVGDQIVIKLPRVTAGYLAYHTDQWANISSPVFDNGNAFMSGFGLVLLPHPYGIAF